MDIDTKISGGKAKRRDAQSGSLDKMEVRSALRPHVVSQGRFVTVHEMPRYRDELVALVVQSLSQVPVDIIWFTYRDIQRYFGVSKATIARRLQEGFVPGVRIVAGQVQADGNVRRFDRTQLHWLLLAVRFGRTLAANVQAPAQANRSS